MNKKTIELPVVKELMKRFGEPSPLIQVLLGPRQVGKTFAVTQFCQKFKKNKTFFVSGDGIESSFWIDEQWQQARETGELLIIDEIQKIPEWSEKIKKLWDEDQRFERKTKCLLLGSSSLTLNQGLTESLSGRFELIKMHHWDFSNSSKLTKMNLDEYLIYGGYPGSYALLKNTPRWAEYLRASIIETVIAKDILLQARVKSPALFRQAFYLLASYPSQVVSYNKLLGQLQDKGNIDQIKYFIELFEGAFLFKAIMLYSKNELRKRGSSPKIIPLAPCLSTLSRLGQMDSEYQGRIFEAAVGSVLVRAGYEIYYWADANFEVDFILEQNNKTVAIEVKSGRNKTSKSLEQFCKKYPTCKVLFIDKKNFAQFSKSPNEFIDGLI